MGADPGRDRGDDLRLDPDGKGVRVIRKGAAEAVTTYLSQNGLQVPAEVKATVEQIARSGGTPLVVAEKKRGALGVIELKDVVKGGIRERFNHLRAMGIRTVMITGDNPLTAAAIAREAGVDGFLAQAGTDKSKLLSANIWITDMAKFAEMNAVWDAWVSPGNTPARATVEAKLASPDYVVEIMVVAAK